MRKATFWVLTGVLMIIGVCQTVEDLWMHYGPGLKVYAREGNFVCDETAVNWLKGALPGGASLPFVNVNGSRTSNVGYFKDFLLALRGQVPPRVSPDKLCTYSQIVRFDIVNDSSRPYTDIALRSLTDVVWTDKSGAFMDSSELGEIAPGESFRVYVWVYSGRAGALQEGSAFRVGGTVTHSTGLVRAVVVGASDRDWFWQGLSGAILLRVAAFGALIWLVFSLTFGRKEQSRGTQPHVTGANQ